jgi:hypothetical protein
LQIAALERRVVEMENEANAAKEKKSEETGSNSDAQKPTCSWWKNFW